MKITIETKRVVSASFSIDLGCMKSACDQIVLHVYFQKVLIFTNECSEN